MKFLMPSRYSANINLLLNEIANVNIKLSFTRKIRILIKSFKNVSQNTLNEIKIL